MAGFRPASLAAVAGGWFNVNSERFLVTARSDYKDDSPTDAVIRAQSRLQCMKISIIIISKELS